MRCAIEQTDAGSHAAERSLRDRSFYARVAAVFSLGLLLRLLILFRASTLAVDGAYYARIARQFTDLDISGALGSIFSPGYPFLMSLFVLVTRNMEMAGRCVSLFMGSLAMMGVCLLTGRVFSRRVGLISLFVVAVHPYLVRSSAEVLSEATCYGLFVVAVVCLVMAYDRGDRRLGFLSGLLLAWAYLTRPEFIVYVVPCLGWLCLKKKFDLAGVLLAGVSLAAAPYIIYLSVNAGHVLISNKQLVINTPLNVSDLRGSIVNTIPRTFENLPSVAFHFAEALFPVFVPFFLIGLWAGKPRNKGVEVLIGAVLVTHVVAMAAMPHYIMRYGVPMVPLAVVWVSLGVHKIVDLTGHTMSRRSGAVAMVLLFGLITGLSLSQNLGALREHRIINKEAGLWLKHHAPGAVIMSRVPQEAFYAEGRHVGLLPRRIRSITYEDLLKRAEQHGVEYLIEDYKMTKYCPDFPAKRSDSDMVRVFSLERKDRFVRIYRFRLPGGDG